MVEFFLWRKEPIKNLEVVIEIIILIEIIAIEIILEEIIIPEEIILEEITEINKVVNIKLNLV